jgi:endonuclease/exonuclease/phosphatase family metal-dependent hydrolase
MKCARYSCFNAAISNLRVEELNLLGNKFTWTNKQVSPLLERLDWCFASVTWMTKYPGSFVSTLSRDISDHTPCVVSIIIDIPKAHNFRFENFWMLHDEFM